MQEKGDVSPVSLEIPQIRLGNIRLGQISDMGEACGGHAKRTKYLSFHELLPRSSTNNLSHTGYQTVHQIVVQVASLVWLHRLQEANSPAVTNIE